MCTIEPTQRRIGRSVEIHQPACEIEMKTGRFDLRSSGICATVTALLLMSAAIPAADTATLPPAQYAGTISYRSGGIGADSSDAMKAEASRYSLEMTFTARMENRDAYTIPSHLSIVDASGSSVLDVTPDGPYVLVNLPIGQYRVTAGAGAGSKTQAVQIMAGGHKKLAFALAQADASR
ncbi:MAG TPA: hypothetical protein VNX47_12850 [Nevskia sp.]|nr:hypothetical protein [Nevskia sp.]